MPRLDAARSRLSSEVLSAEIMFQNRNREHFVTALESCVP